MGAVATVPEAIAAIASERIDAVLFDANLAGTSSAPIAEERDARRLPFVVVTWVQQHRTRHRRPALRSAGQQAFHHCRYRRGSGHDASSVGDGEPPQLPRSRALAFMSWGLVDTGFLESAGWRQRSWIEPSRGEPHRSGRSDLNRLISARRAATAVSPRVPLIPRSSRSVDPGTPSSMMLSLSTGSPARYAISHSCFQSSDQVETPGRRGASRRAGDWHCHG